MVRRLLTSLGVTLLLAIMGSVSLAPEPAHAYVSTRSSRFARAKASSSASSRAGATAKVTPSTAAVGLFAQEEQIVSVVEHAEPAVTSVVISKDLPVLEKYYEQVSPDGDFPGLQVQVPRFRQNGTESKVVGAGSAFFVSADGLLLTNNHVVEDQTASYTVLKNDGSRLKADVVLRDAATDVAVLRVSGRNFPYLSLAASDNVRLAQIAIAIGNSLGEFRNTVSVGVVSGLRRSIKAGGLSGGRSETLTEIIQTDAAINEGNSGGPLLNSRGDVIGMNVALATDAQNVGFALPAKTLRAALERYRGR